MGTKYASKATSGYDASPPPDDGTVSAANKITWASIKTKLTDVLKTFGEAINSALVTALDTSTTTQSAAYTTLASDHQKPIEVSGTTTISLGDAATMAVGYQTTIKNVGTATVTVALITPTDTLDGITNDSTTLSPGQSATFAVNSTANGYRIISGGKEIPPGAVMPFAGSTAPGGWLLCNGQAVSRTTYADLFNVISTTYGTGDGSTTFNVPDCTGRVIAGKESTATRLTSGVSGVDGGTLGASGGDQNSQQHTHTASVTDPGHTHNINVGSAGTGASAVADSNAAAGSTHAAPVSNTTGISVSNANAGSGSSENVQPTIVLNYIIKH